VVFNKTCLKYYRGVSLAEVRGGQAQSLGQQSLYDLANYDDPDFDFAIHEDVALLASAFVFPLAVFVSQVIECVVLEEKFPAAKCSTFMALYDVFLVAHTKLHLHVLVGCLGNIQSMVLQFVPEANGENFILGVANLKFVHWHDALLLFACYRHEKLVILALEYDLEFLAIDLQGCFDFKILRKQEHFSTDLQDKHT